MGRQFVFRLNLPGHRFLSRERFETAEDAAFYADAFKSHIASSYRLTGPTLSRSLDPARFSELLAEVGADPADLKPLLPESCREYLMDGGHEMLTAYARARTAKPFAPPAP